MILYLVEMVNIEKKLKFDVVLGFFSFFLRTAGILICDLSLADKIPDKGRLEHTHKQQ